MASSRSLSEARIESNRRITPVSSAPIPANAVGSSHAIVREPSRTSSASVERTMPATRLAITSITPTTARPLEIELARGSGGSVCCVIRVPPCWVWHLEGAAALEDSEEPSASKHRAQDAHRDERDHRSDRRGRVKPSVCGAAAERRIRKCARRGAVPRAVAAVKAPGRTGVIPNA